MLTPMCGIMRMDKISNMLEKVTNVSTKKIIKKLA